MPTPFPWCTRGEQNLWRILIPSCLEIRMGNLRSPRDTHRSEELSGTWWSWHLLELEKRRGAGRVWKVLWTRRMRAGETRCDWLSLSKLAEPLKSGKALVLPGPQRVPCQGIRPTQLGWTTCGSKINELDHYISAWKRLKNMMLEGKREPDCRWHRMIHLCKFE